MRKFNLLGNGGEKVLPPTTETIYTTIDKKNFTNFEKLLKNVNMKKDKKDNLKTIYTTIDKKNFTNFEKLLKNVIMKKDNKDNLKTIYTTIDKKNYKL